jgi:hypothetical protein
MILPMTSMYMYMYRQYIVNKYRHSHFYKKLLGLPVLKSLRSPCIKLKKLSYLISYCAGHLFYKFVKVIGGSWFLNGLHASFMLIQSPGSLCMY